MSIGARIKQIRKKAGLSQKAFAETLGVSKGAIGSYETEKQAPGSLFIIALCDNFHVEPRWLLKGEGAAYDDKTINNYSDLTKHNMFLDEVEPRIKELREELEHVKSELLIAELERDRAKEEAFKAMKVALKAHGLDINKE